MTRVLGFLIRNWPLKLAAVVLATLLYGALSLSESTQTFERSVSIEVLGQSPDVVLLSDLGVVRQIRYYASEQIGTQLDAKTFRATVDLSGVQPGTDRVSVAISVEAIDPRIQVIDFEPRRVSIQLDAVVDKTVDVKVETGTVPAGLDVRDPVLSTRTVTVRGPESVIRRVAWALAAVRIEPSGLDVNRDVELVPIDEFGQPLAPVDVQPDSVHVRIAVFTDRQTRSLPVNPVVTGTPAAGFEVASITVTPAVLTVEGDADQLEPLVRLDTLPVSISGAASTVTETVDLDLPAGVLPLDSGAVQVVIEFREVTATRSLVVGIELIGLRSDRAYDVALDRVLVTLGGPLTELDRVVGSRLVVRIDVSTLKPGTMGIPVALDLPPGVTLVASSPAVVDVTVTDLTTPSPSASPSAAP